MTASAPSTPRPGRAAPAVRPVGALWILLLVGLLTALPCAAHARAATAERSGFPVTVPADPPVGPPTGLLAVPLADAPPHLPGTAATGPATTPRTLDDRLRAESHRHWTWCSVDGNPPHRNNGCSSHPYCAQDAQLPNPPPHQQPAAAPRPETAEVPPRVVPAGLPVGPHPAPDLHELQVNRS
ncbi:hypothetical protein [Kitasatospora purpeofusca]|uniref:hypothetical protein n=1 Tax=Kitasatospora purpeofusca TaxID=67352 RepID=UPI002A5AF076|nr:hypothetical protein [Kitasatospora purpeofusca]MDY0813604.1 hypothetical protein [Kitasatospora purpeofusca]